MKIHEYQAKEILRKFGVPTPTGKPCFSVSEAVEAAKSLGGSTWVVKAQIHAGGRGKGGGVKVAQVARRSETIRGQHTGYDAGYASDWSQRPSRATAAD